MDTHTATISTPITARPSPIRGKWTDLQFRVSACSRTDDAINLLEHVLADRERILGDEHPDTRSVRDVLSRWRSAGG
ncbi:tetratricopeptide repeat protein [Streptomyces sp. NPDC001732]